MKISIIIPIFNIKLNEFTQLKNYLMTQTIGFENIEIIFLDNNSTYTYSKNFIKTFETKFENIKCIFFDKTHDKIYTYLKGLDYVTSEYVMFYDYHELYNDVCEKLYIEINKSNSDVVIGNCVNYDLSADGGVNKEDLYDNNVLTYTIFKNDFIRNLSFRNCKSITQFHYIINSSTEQICFLKKPFTQFNNHFNEGNLLNSKKLDILSKIVNKQYSDLTISIKTPNPTKEKHWGDFFFALSLRKSFQKKGFNVIIQEREFWEDNDDEIDIVLVLRGLIEYNPKPQHLNLMWNISHPDDVTLEEYEKYDFVFIASKKYSKEINEKINTNVYPLLQCTDPEIFYSSKNELYNEDILFVGITRGVFRKIVKDISQTDHDFSVYGFGWEKYIDEKFIKGPFIDNKILNQAYSSCKILLNDHWDDMLEKDFPSNRLFDALACGSFIISDDIPSAHDLFKGNVITYNTTEDLNDKIDYYLRNEYERNAIAKKGQKLVLENHTFDNRVNEILNILNEYEFDDFICTLKTSITHINDGLNENNNLRIIIVDNNDSVLISNSVSSIASISSAIPISIIELNNFSKNKFYLNESKKAWIIDNLNEIINNVTEDFILIIESGDIVKKEIFDKFNEIDIDEYAHIGAIIFDDISMISKKPNYKLGFSLELYLETDYINYSVLLNRKALLNNNGFNKKFFNNFIRNSILELYNEDYEILKEDIIGIELKNELKNKQLKEDELLINKFLNGKQFNLIINKENNTIFPVYSTNNHKASIIIPFKDQVEVTKVCVNSILNKTNYQNFEIILVDNNSYENETFEYLKEINKHEKCKVITYEKEFNWSKINNYASTKASGDILVFLNNDTEVINQDWLSLLIGDVIQPNIGAVGSKLLYPDNTIQHMGVVVGLTYLAGHIFAKELVENIPNIYNLHRRNVSAVTGACVAFTKETFNKIGKFDEDYEISFSDVEICLRAIEMGYRNIFNPRSILYHHEMKSRGTGDFRDIDRILAFNAFKFYFEQGDPFFNKNYSLNSHNLTIRNKNEIPNYKTFWEKFQTNRESHLKSIINARANVKLKMGNEIFQQDISKSELINNMILMKNFFKNPKVELNTAIWFLPKDNLKLNYVDEILRFAEFMSKNEDTYNYFVLNSQEHNTFFEKLVNNYKELKFEFISLRELIENPIKVDIGLCVDWFSAYNLAKFNSCITKFYFLLNQTNLNYGHSLNKKLIEQSYNFKFIGVSNSREVFGQYKQFNNMVKYFKPTVNTDIFFPSIDEKQKKMTVLLYIGNNGNVEFELGIEVLKILFEYYNDKINIIVAGENCDLSEYGLDKVSNLGKIDSDAELANIYRRSHICLVFSFNNLLPQNALKCMACGCALLTNKGNSNLLKQKENAILTEPNLNCIIEDLINLINDFKLREKIISNGFKTIAMYNGENEYLKILNFMKNPYY